MKLIATWKPDQDAAMELPNSVKWDDGTPATLDDFAQHQLDTYTLRQGRNGGLEQHFFPDIVAEVAYDWFAKDWVVKVPDVITAALGLHDPDATDDQITTELYTFPFVYRAKIVRPTTASLTATQTTSMGGKRGKRSIAMTDELVEGLKRQAKAFETMFGRPPGPNDPVFFDPHSDAPKTLSEAQIAEFGAGVADVMREVGVDPDVVYAYGKLGFIATAENWAQLDAGQRQEWIDAVAEYAAIPKN